MKRVFKLSVSVILVLVTVFVLGSAEVYGQGADGSNILISSRNVLYEYTRDGVFVRQVTIPLAPGCCGTSRDLVVSGPGTVAIYNGTFSPVLSTYDFAAGTWTDRTAAGWSTVNNVSYGGVAISNGYIFATDMRTYSGGEAKGIVRFAADGTFQRFFETNDYIDVSAGLDGKLYALRNVYGDLDVIDPATMTLLGSLDLGHTLSIRAVAVDTNGDIFAASWNDNLYHFDASGVQLATCDSTLSDLTDIDIDENGTLIVGCRFGEIALTDTGFTSLSVINVQGANYQTFVAFGNLENTEVAPWRDNATGTAVTGINWHYAMGYHFQPQVDGQVVKLGGFFNGTKQVKLFNRTTGVLLAEATVTANNDWQYVSITPVDVQQGENYTVAVYLAGSGASYRWGVDPFPAIYGDIKIQGTTYISTYSDPNARPVNTVGANMYGQADFIFKKL